MTGQALDLGINPAGAIPLDIRVLGIDPGRFTGLCLLRVVGSDVTIESLRVLALVAPGEHVDLTLADCGLRRAHSIGMEMPFVSFQNHGNTALKQGRLVGWIEVVLARNGRTYHEITPADAKKALTGHGRAGVRDRATDRKGDTRRRGKEAMVRFARAMPGWETAALGIGSTKLDLEAAADAVGVALATLAKVKAERFRELAVYTSTNALEAEGRKAPKDGR